jgi:DNA-directed RNA polymerase subunit RPC12/RpoP
MSKTELSNYDTLECPDCDTPTKPSKINNDGSVTYVCKECEEKFTISVDGDLVE